ncbi:MAG: (2Fe-2S)-binding protein [Rhodothermales bacterium]|nr:(2Fe-2S)-binding protein [Rhodothermales bacterium]
MEIDRCYCFGVSFSTLVDIARQTGAKTIPDLQKKIVFGRQCELCHEYVKRALRTGETVFHEIILPKSG